MRKPILVLLLVLSACRSDPVHYHTLRPLLGGPARLVKPGGALLIERVTVPAQVDRAQIVVRQGSNGLAILETDWWGASLADELHSALLDQLNRRPLLTAKAALRVDVQRFDLVPGRYALLDVKWRLRSARADTAPVPELSCQGIVQAPSGSSIDELVMAQQANLQKVADMISDSTRGQCPST